MKKRYLFGAIIAGVMSLAPIVLISPDSELSSIKFYLTFALFLTSMILFFYGVYASNKGREMLSTYATLTECDWNSNVMGNYWSGRIQDGICTFTFVLDNGKEIKLKGANSAQSEKLFQAKGKSGLLVVLTGMEFVEDFIIEDVVSGEEHSVIDADLFLQKYQGE